MQKNKKAAGRNKHCTGSIHKIDQGVDWNDVFKFKYLGGKIPQNKVRVKIP